jgi:hypothetical protein
VTNRDFAVTSPFVTWRHAVLLSLHSVVPQHSPFRLRLLYMSDIRVKYGRTMPHTDNRTLFLGGCIRVLPAFLI